MRNKKDVTISAEGRDHGKLFRITEMSAFDAEEWATRATLALMPRLTKEVPEAVAAEIKDNPDMPNLSRIGLLLGSISFPETKDLMRELMKCIVFIPDPATGRERAIGLGGSEDIEEVETIHTLRREALALHTGFTLPASLFNLIAEMSRVDIRNM